MTHVTAFRTSVVCLALCLATACGTKEKETDTAIADTHDSTGAAAPAPQIVDVGAETEVPDSEKASGSVMVSSATPSAVDGVVQVTRRQPLQLPGVSAAFAIEGVSGALTHGFLIGFDSAGAIKYVQHKWSNADNSLVANTACGALTRCPVGQVTADAKTGAVTFTGLVLTGLDVITAAKATSTLTGTVK